MRRSFFDECPLHTRKILLPKTEAVDDTQREKCCSQSTHGGSLGTPSITNRFVFNRKENNFKGRFCSTDGTAQTNYCVNGFTEDNCDVVLVATRPLLKALARECKPFPPWCVGFNVPEEATEELKLFASFFRATPEEIYFSKLATRLALTIMRSVWPDVVLKPMSTTAAGISPLKDVTQHFYAEGSFVAEGDLERTQKQIQDVANKHGAHVYFGTDYRDLTCVVITDTRTGRRLTIRFGSCAAIAEGAANIFKTKIASNEDFLAALTLLDALVRQNKIFDDTGTNKSALSGEALATMLVAIINSYSPNDTPNAARLVMDFFLTFGFGANFDHVRNSVTAHGMEPPTPKAHRNAQLSVLDPSGGTRNITSKLENVAHLLAVFNYCYTALSQIAHVPRRERRAQSILSTIIGGEAYWSRVLQLYHEKIEPYVSIVDSKKYRLAHVL